MEADTQVIRLKQKESSHSPLDIADPKLKKDLAQFTDLLEIKKIILIRKFLVVMLK